MGQYRGSTGPMLAASAQYWPGTGSLWHVIGHIKNLLIVTHWKPAQVWRGLRCIFDIVAILDLNPFLLDNKLLQELNTFMILYLLL